MTRSYKIKAYSDSDGVWRSPDIFSQFTMLIIENEPTCTPTGLLDRLGNPIMAFEYTEQIGFVRSKEKTK